MGRSQKKTGDEKFNIAVKIIPNWIPGVEVLLPGTLFKKFKQQRKPVV